jgi:hypothetical protein
MWFLQAFGIGFALTLGMEVALGLCIALKYVTRSKKK